MSAAERFYLRLGIVLGFLSAWLMVAMFEWWPGL